MVLILQWIQPANGEAVVKAQIGPVRVNETASQVSVYPHGPGVIDINGEGDPLFLYKGRRNYYSLFFDGLSLDKMRILVWVIVLSRPP